MIKDKLLKKVFWFVLGATLSGLLVGIFVIYPSFTRLVVKNAEDEAVMTARHISHMAFPGDAGVAGLSPERLAREVELLARDFQFMKLKIFDAAGKVVYSTDAEDIGEINKKDYFRNVVAQGTVFTKMVKKDAMSMENQKVSVDVVETYVPIMREGGFAGALEMYYDVSDKNRMLQGVVTTSNALTISLTALFLLIIIIVLLRLDRTITEREEHLDELERLNTSLAGANSEIEEHRGKLQEAFDQMSQLIQEVSTTHNIDLRYENIHLEKCYEKMNCTWEDCACYGGEAVRCWQVAGTFCGNEVQGAYAQKYGNCKLCEVFRDAAADPVNMIGEHFNNMMHILEIKHMELECANDALEDEIKVRKAAEEELKKMIASLEVALSEIKTLRGIVPICSHCKKIRDDKGFWNKVDIYVQEHTEARFSHGVCPDCQRKYYADLFDDDDD